MTSTSHEKHPSRHSSGARVPAMHVHMPSRRAFTSAGTNGTDLGGWAVYGSDWRFFFDCMFAPVVPQAAKALDRLDIKKVVRSTEKPTLMMRLQGVLRGRPTGIPKVTGSRPVASILPRHGPVIKQGVMQLLNEYGRCVHFLVLCSCC